MYHKKKCKGDQIMENMKRALSAFMALVLVLGMLPGVPMFAGAEEVETQPETVAVETTEAATKAVTEKVEEDKGCGGVIGAGAIAIVAVTGAALAIGKKKED
jgi:hypothetical protein